MPIKQFFVVKCDAKSSEAFSKMITQLEKFSQLYQKRWFFITSSNTIFLVLLCMLLTDSGGASIIRNASNFTNENNGAQTAKGDANYNKYENGSTHTTCQFGSNCIFGVATGNANYILYDLTI